MRFEGGKHHEVDCIGDTGAAPSIAAEADLDMKILGGRLVPSEAKIMQDAQHNQFSSLGAAKIAFRLGNSNHRFVHKWQVTPGSSTPTLLGVQFWDMYEAKFDFVKRVIQLTTPEGVTEVEFTIGDEDEEEKEVALYCV